MTQGASYGDAVFGWTCPLCDFSTMDFTELENHLHPDRCSFCGGKLSRFGDDERCLNCGQQGPLR